jgi:hypothetical protein
MNDDDRIAYLAGDPTGPIDDDDERAALEGLRALLADPGLWDEPDPALEDAVVTAVTAEASAPSAEGIAPPQPPGAATAKVIPMEPRRRRWSRSLVVVGAAAATVIVVAAALLLSGRDTDDAESFAMSLEPTEEIPGASGRATLTRTDSGWRIELDATGLPRLDSGEFYQGWLRDEGGTLVPIGSFNEGADVVLWAGVSPLEFSTLTVTRESADGNQESSGVRVLVGTLAPD